MVAYSFNARFEAPIINGTKCQTIRADRKRHARPGEQIQLYIGMRTRSCRQIGVARCTEALPIRIDVIEMRIYVADAPVADVEQFARSDGFTGTRDMQQFWIDNHPDDILFDGLLIRWADFRLAA